MKKGLLFVFVAAFAACNSSNDSAKVEAMSTGKDTTASAQTINSPYAVGYSSKFEMGDAKYAETLLNIWKTWDNGNLAAGKDMFADTVEVHFADSPMMRLSRDSVIASAQAYRNTITSSVSSVDAVTALRSTDKNENWALIWGKEIDTDKKGKVDSVYLQETWRFNKDGKADLMFQYRSAPKAAKK
jgi:hypothetical protein